MDDQATLTVIRKRQFFSGGQGAIFCNGQEVGRLRAGDALTMKVEPGSHKLSVVPINTFLVGWIGKYAEHARTTLMISCEPREHLTFECSVCAFCLYGPPLIFEKKLTTAEKLSKNLKELMGSVAIVLVGILVSYFESFYSKFPILGICVIFIGVVFSFESAISAVYNKIKLLKGPPPEA